MDLPLMRCNKWAEISNRPGNEWADQKRGPESSSRAHHISIWSDFFFFFFFFFLIINK